MIKKNSILGKFFKLDLFDKIFIFLYSNLKLKISFEKNIYLLIDC